MSTLGRGFQFLGLITLPVAMVLELSGKLGRKFDVSDMLVMLIFGTILFALGRVIEGYARR